MAKQRQRQQGCAFAAQPNTVGHRASAHLIYRRWIVITPARLDPGSACWPEVWKTQKITLDEAEKDESAYL
jgi:hypothetical protein